MTSPICAWKARRGADFIGPQPQAGDAIVSKTHFSAFARTGLAEQLHAQGVDTLVLAGLTTECCVASSAWDAFRARLPYLHRRGRLRRL